MTRFVTTNGPMEDLSLRRLIRRSRSRMEMMSKLRGFGGEVGMVGRDTSESKAGVPADPRARREEVTLKSLPRTAPKEAGSHRHTRSFGKLVLRKIVPTKRSSMVPMPVPHLHLPLVPRPATSSSSPHHNRKWAWLTCQSALARLVPGGSMSRGQV